MLAGFIIFIMASCYVSTIIKYGANVIIPTSVVQISSSSTFWDLFEYVWMANKPQQNLPDPVNVTIMISKNDTFSSSPQAVKFNHEVAVCKLFDCKYVLLTILLHVYLLSSKKRKIK